MSRRKFVSYIEKMRCNEMLIEEFIREEGKELELMKEIKKNI